MRKVLRFCGLLVSLLLFRSHGVSRHKTLTEEDIYAAMKQAPTSDPPAAVLQTIYSDPGSAVVYEQIKKHLVWFEYRNLLYGIFDECQAFEIVVLYPNGKLVGFYRLEK